MSSELNLYSRLVEQLYASRVMNAVIPTVKSCAAKELRDCRSILDLGCGSESFIPLISGAAEVIGVEADPQSAAAARSSGYYAEVINGDLRDLKFAPNTFDAVVLIEVLEHMPFSDGQELLKKAKSWSKKKLLVTTPNGFWPQGALHGNEYQRHVSGWKMDDLHDHGMRVKGLAGFKIFRKELEDVIDPEATALSFSMRWKPWQFWFVLSALSQIASYRLPKLAFELFAIWECPQE